MARTVAEFISEFTASLRAARADGSWPRDYATSRAEAAAEANRRLDAWKPLRDQLCADVPMDEPPISYREVPVLTFVVGPDPTGQGPASID